MRYAIADKFTGSVFCTNVKRVTQCTIGTDRVFQDNDTSARILSSPGGVTTLFGESPPLGQSSALEEHRPRFPTPFSRGRTVRRWHEEGLEGAELREDKPIQIPAILAGKYKTLEREHRGIRIRLSRYLSARERSMQQIASIISALLDLHEPYLGAFPFAEPHVIKINSYGFGQSPAGIIFFITREAFSPLEEVLARLFSQGINAPLAHEPAHTRWGHDAKLGAGEHQWLSESSAEYLAPYAMGQLLKKQEFDATLRRWKSNCNFVGDKGTVDLANHPAGQAGWEDRGILLYYKGPLVLQALRQELGESHFFTVLKSFMRSFKLSQAQAQHFLGITDYVTRQQWRPWFDRYLLGTEWPAEREQGSLMAEGMAARGQRGVGVG